MAFALTGEVAHSGRSVAAGLRRYKPRCRSASTWPDGTPSFGPVVRFLPSPLGSPNRARRRLVARRRSVCL